MHVMASTNRHLVVDGSNIATESRTLPSLSQLDEAVRAVQAEDPDRLITVIVDATFSHRIDESERKQFEDANNAGEIVMPPAGAVGRGDAFILQVAEKAGAAVLSNDSFQEFHGDHPWLFEEGRLIGGKPVEGIGWVFVPRVPVRGPASRRATREAKKAAGKSQRGSSKQASKRASGPAPKPSADTPPPGGKKSGDRRRSGRRKNDQPQPATKKAKKSTPESTSPAKSSTKKAQSKKTQSKKAQSTNKNGKRSSSKKLEELNNATDFMRFVTKHSIGDEVTGTVDRFSSHGCYLYVSSAQCYLPSSAMGDPPPTRARDVVSIGQTVNVKVESLDSDRRGINVVLVRTVEDDGNKQPASGGSTRGRSARKTSQVLSSVADEPGREENLTRSKTTVATKKTAKKAAKKTAKKAAPKKAAKKTAAKATSSARATKATAKKTAKKAAPKKAAAKKTAKKATKKKK